MTFNQQGVIAVTWAGASIPVAGSKLLSHRTLEEIPLESMSLLPWAKAIILTR